MRLRSASAGTGLRRGYTAGSPALLAQLVEHLHGKEGVDGSSPSEGSKEPAKEGVTRSTECADLQVFFVSVMGQQPREVAPGSHVIQS
jgi:hypothetical protein